MEPSDNLVIVEITLKKVNCTSVFCDSKAKSKIIHFRKISSKITNIVDVGPYSSFSYLENVLTSFSYLENVLTDNPLILGAAPN